ncbi:hypothetical protein AnaeK_4245 [Anaeromyxobacter sp. K]|uniref:hypothetical protein n=1 Tax=Anaeromyxobacter sp. (strain K) TaxID=447217 RepID=UPI00015F9304|nr:hypothetical protein [Anaeromyxobacter sp. K]ACG75448.1 hypothetical protein AnaeK_4245 [Anaeromyxobacter sp. K]
MNAHRESFYRCTIASPEGRRVAHVRAWDAREAEELFRAELRADGLDAAGPVEVAALGDAPGPLALAS